MLRERVRSPPPQVVAHAPHADQFVTTQSTAHSCVLHASSWESAAQLEPPWAVGCVTLRERVRMPLPHEAEHWENAP